MTNSSVSRRRAASRARPGSARWFRRYRPFVMFGWLAVLAALLWLLLIRQDHRPAMPAAPRSDSAETKARPAAKLAAVDLPADDAPHANTTEWWYYNGQVQTDSGERYSFHLATFLRQGTLAHTAFHGSLRDHQTGKHYTDQVRTEGKPADGQSDGFGFSYGQWQIAGSGPKHTVKMGGKDFSIDLALHDRSSPVLHQAPGTPVAGLLDLGAAGKSYYTSRPRMQAEGRLRVDGVSKAVRGEVWFDHQWGDFEASTLRWNWFALQLADGADLMIYEIFDRQGVPLLRTGTYVNTDGVASPLGANDFKTNARGSWKSKLSGVSYPMDWTITVPGQGLDLQLEAVSRQSQFDARLTTLNVYWEGAVKISGSQSGVGFQELSGYPAATVTGTK